MICFEVSLNGKKLATAGLPGCAVLSNIVTWARRRGKTSGVLGMTLGGLDADSNEGPGDHVDWWDGPLQAGDEVLVRVLKDVPVDPPVHRRTAKEAKTDHQSLLRMELAQLEERRAEIETQLKLLEAAESTAPPARRAKNPSRSPSRTKK